MSNQPTTQELILQEVRDLTASVGEIRLGLNALAEKFRALEKRVEKLEADCCYVEVEGLKTIPARDREWLDGEFTMTPPIDLRNRWQDGDNVTISYNGKEMYGIVDIEPGTSRITVSPSEEGHNEHP